MKVATLITVKNPAHYKQCTLALDTLRVGFPTADIHVTINRFGFGSEDIQRRANDIDAYSHIAGNEFHHADWIENWLGVSDEPVCIVDPDTIFWKNCEWIADQPTGFFRGMYVPQHWNHWSQCHYMDRFHTSFLYFPRPSEILRALDAKFPRRKNPYVPFNPFHPTTTVVNGRALFYDTCSLLYHAIGGEPFTTEHLDCYDHINSASFFTEMCELFKDEPDRLAAYKRIHELAVTDRQALKGLWRATQSYYDQQAQELHARIKQIPLY